VKVMNINQPQFAVNNRAIPLIMLLLSLLINLSTYACYCCQKKAHGIKILMSHLIIAIDGIILV